MYALFRELKRLNIKPKEETNLSKQASIFFKPAIIKGIAELMGGIPLGELMEMVGKFASLKSQIAAQVSWEVVHKHQKGVIYMDTEGGQARFLFPHWLDVLNKKYGGDVQLEHRVIDLRKWQEITKKSLVEGEKTKRQVKDIPYKILKKAPTNKPKIIVIGARDIERLSLFFGSVIEIDYGKGKGKIQAYVQPETGLFKYPWQFPISKIVEKEKMENGGMIVLDSITMPVEETYTGGQQSLPGRKYAFMTTISGIRSVVNEYDLYGLVNSHESSQDSSMIKSQPKAVGGVAVGHNFKFVLGIKGIKIGDGKEEVKEMRRNTRRLFTLRHPTKKPRWAYRDVLMTDEGVVDV